MTTREASSIQENRVAKKLGGVVNSNSGAGNFNKGDIRIPDIAMTIECKTCMKPKDSFSIKKDWLVKNKNEAFITRSNYTCIAFNFNCEDKTDYYIIDDNLMSFLVEKLKEEQ